MLFWSKEKKIGGKNQKSWLKGDGRFRSFKLINVKNYMDVNSLWTAGTSTGNKIADSVHENSNLRLREALDCHETSYSIFEQGRYDIKTAVFTDVVVWVPATFWDVAIQLGTEQIAGIANHLSFLHHRDFGERLFNNRAPSYTVMPSPCLDETRGEIVFQFGQGVFVPTAKDKLIKTITFSMNSENLDLPNWIFFEDVGKQRIERPVGFYENQRGLMIGPNIDVAPVQLTSKNCEAWFAHKEGHIYISLLGGDKPAFADEKYIQFDSSETIDSNEKIVIFKDGQFSPQVAGESSPKLKLSLKDIRESHDEDIDQNDNNEAKSSVQEEMSEQIINESFIYEKKFSEEEPFSGECETVFESGQGLNIVNPHVILEGYGLFAPQQISSLKSWVLWLNEEGKLFEKCPADTTNPWCVTLSAHETDDALFIKRPGEKGSFERIEKLPWIYEDDRGVSFEVIPSPIPLYIGLLQISSPSTYTNITDKPLTFGRQKDLVDVALDFLNKMGAATWTLESGNTGAPIGALHAGRKHMAISFSDEGFDIELLGASATTYFFKKDGQIYTTGKNSTEKIRLVHGERILMGSALFRVDAGQSEILENLEKPYNGQTVFAF